ncbi:Ribosomal protein L17 family protein [Theileria parva strain Muguga]|uniref:Ribosomal protein L17 family protein n=1 Tax=Theileria parva strain Muguga TaxID=333668 RepID=UPI001C622C54|nr:Ribosomal protein L17 family protein [Theileria parva strain Muguga]KAF5153423.1 Ribosomal protein L17 family protein [Theileria parva strain Muguga]
MGFSVTCKFVSLGLRTRVFRKFRGQPNKSYDWIRNNVDKLIRNGRLELTLPRAKELQQYVEELIYHAKIHTEDSDLLVESVIRTPECRSLLYEKYVPLYKDRQFFFTRVVNQYKLRQRDSAPLAYIELVNTENEIYPAKPVGIDKLNHILNLMKSTRRDYRKYHNYGRKMGLIDKDGNLINKIQINTKPWYEEGNIETVDETSLSDEKVRRRLEMIRKVEVVNGKVIEPFNTLYQPNTATVKKTLRFNP